MFNKLFNMHNKLFLNKLFICLIKLWELFSVEKSTENIYSVNVFKVTLLCEAATNSLKLNRKWTP